MLVCGLCFERSCCEEETRRLEGGSDNLVLGSVWSWFLVFWFCLTVLSLEEFLVAFQCVCVCVPARFLPCDASNLNLHTVL